MINKDRYEGYLSPYLDDIIRLWEGGNLSMIEIADWLRRTYPRPCYYTHAANVKYVLNRIGYVVPPNPKYQHRPTYWGERIQLFIDEKDIKIRLSYEYARLGIRTNKRGKGRPIDMGGPRDVWIEKDPWSDQ